MKFLNLFAMPTQRLLFFKFLIMLIIKHKNILIDNLCFCKCNHVIICKRSLFCYVDFISY